MQRVVAKNCVGFTAMVASLLVVAATGCGPSGLGRVSGRVTVDGQPAPEGINISFEPVVPSELGISIAVVGSDGQYVAQNPVTGAAGVAVGMCLARVIEDEKTTILPKKEGQMPKRRYDAKAYEDLLRFEVKSGSNTIDLEIPSAGK